MTSFCHAQLCVTYEENGMLPCDSAYMEVVSYSDAGLNGENQTWDFSGATIQNTYKCRYMIAPDSLSYLSSCHERLHAYHQTTDSLLLFREETLLHFMDYRKQPMLSLVYPMKYGDKVQRPFYGEGMYCGRIYLRRIGTTMIEADAYGTLIRAKGDTLHNVLRIHTLITSSLRQSPDSVANRTELHQQEITEHFQWFAEGVRYPVYETITSTLYNDGEAYATGQTACRYMAKPSAFEDGEGIVQQESPSEFLFTFSPAYMQNHFAIDYTLRKPARLQVVVTDVMGMLHRNETFFSEAGPHHYMIDCAALKPGQYIVYINVNGEIFNSKFTHQ